MKNKYNITKEFLVREYFKYNKTEKEIADKVECSIVTIIRRFKEYNISVKNHSDRAKGKHLDTDGNKNPNFKHGKYCKDNINYCIDCGTKISSQAKRCAECENKHHSLLISGENNSNFGKPRSKEIIRKIRETKIKNGDSQGKKNSMFGKITHGKGSYYKKIWMRSSWEIKYAKYLDENKIKWQYEPKCFELRLKKKDTTYTPDFYLPKTDEYVEIKGYWRDDAKVKFNLFKQKYPKIKIKIMDKKNLQEKGVI